MAVDDDDDDDDDDDVDVDTQNLAVEGSRTVLALTSDL